MVASTLPSNSVRTSKGFVTPFEGAGGGDPARELRQRFGPGQIDDVVLAGAAERQAEQLGPPLRGRHPAHLLAADAEGKPVAGQRDILNVFHVANQPGHDAKPLNSGAHMPHAGSCA